MIHEQANLEMHLFNLEELAEPENRTKMCYAFMRSGHLFHQELAILNPKPTQFTPGYVFPLDFYKYTYHIDSGEELFPLEKFQTTAAEADSPIYCIGSHLKEEDRTLQLISLPQSMATGDLLPKELICIRFLTPVSADERERIMTMLEDEYLSL